MIRPLLLAVGALLLATACGAPAAVLVDDPVPPQSIEIPTTPEPPQSPPTWVAVPAIGAESSLVPLGLTAVGELEVPPEDQPLQAGYYAGAKPDEIGDEVLPGETGPAVIAGHVDGVIDGVKGRAGIFARLHELVPGDEVRIERADGSRLRFLVDRVEKHPKDRFPTAAVYGATPGPELRLITCGGPFDRSSGHYTDNWIVFAHLA